MKRRRATCLPKPSRQRSANDPTLTIDTFIADVPLDSHRSTLVYLRKHGGRQYVRWRVFHRHRKLGYWHPDKRRAFVVPLGSANALAGAIAAALTGEASTGNPNWLSKLDAERTRLLPKLQELNAPPLYFERKKRRWSSG